MCVSAAAPAAGPTAMEVCPSAEEDASPTDGAVPAPLQVSTAARLPVFVTTCVGEHVLWPTCGHRVLCNS